MASDSGLFPNGPQVGIMAPLMERTEGHHSRSAAGSWWLDLNSALGGTGTQYFPHCILELEP